MTADRRSARSEGTTGAPSRPIVLGANQPDTFYRGGGRIARLRGEGRADLPEDWVASTTTRYGESSSGLTVLPDGRTLLEAIAADPVGWLGARSGDGIPGDSGVLVKLLDAGQRLPVHVHPTREFARAHLASPYGKTEAWLVLEAAPDAVVHLGFSRDVESEELGRWVADQDVDAMLRATNELPIRAGDAILCPAGMPHAIGEGVFVLEVQEPTDLSVLLEWEGFTQGPPQATLGLPLEEALTCVDRRACTPARLRELRSPANSSLLPPEAQQFFRLDELNDAGTRGGFAVLVAISGNGSLTGTWGSTPVSAGTTLVMPAAAGDYRVSGAVRVCRVRPAQ